MPFDDTVFLKKNVSVLTFFSEEQIRKITSEIERNFYKIGQTVMFQGEVSQNFHVIKKGRVEIFTKFEGEKVGLGELGAGDFFGEVTLLESSAAIATVKALEDDTEILMINHDSFQTLLKENPALEKALRDRIAERRQSKTDAIKKQESH